MCPIAVVITLHSLLEGIYPGILITPGNGCPEGSFSDLYYNSARSEHLGRSTGEGAA